MSCPPGPGRVGLAVVAFLAPDALVAFARQQALAPPWLFFDLALVHVVMPPIHANTDQYVGVKEILPGPDGCVWCLHRSLAYLRRPVSYVRICCVFGACKAYIVQPPVACKIHLTDVQTPLGRPSIWLTLCNPSQINPLMPIRS